MNKSNRTKKSYTLEVPLNGFSVIHYRNSEIIEIPYEEYSTSLSMEDFFNDENIDEMA